MEVGFFGDDPRTGAPGAPDLLDRKTLAGHVVALLDRVRAHSPSSVLGVIGAWGSGKSSLLNIVTDQLREDGSDWVVGEYNPWRYSDLESSVHGFFTTLRDALPKEERWSDARKRLGELGRAVSPLGKLGALVGLDATELIRAGADAVAGDSSAAVMHAKAEKALRDAGRPILMVLDDVDRLTPAELLIAFKLVRLVGRLPNVYYLLAYDERTIIEVLSRTDLAGGDEGRARDYLEKMVQVRLDLPPLRDQQASGLVDAALNEVITSSGVSLGPDDVQRLSTGYHEHLKDRLNTPRAINRFFAQVDAFYGLVAGEVDFVDFVLMTFLRTAEPGVYAMLRRHKTELTATDYWNFADKDMPLPERLDRWRKRLTDSGVTAEHLDGVVALLALLFVPIKSAKERMNYGSAYLQDVGRRQGVGHIDYFDRYYSFGVPAEDVPDSVVVEALQQLARGEPGTEVEVLAARLVDSTEKVLRKIAAQRAAGVRAGKEVVLFLAEHVAALPDNPGFRVFDPRHAVAFFVEEVLADVDASQGPELLRGMAASDGGLWLAAHVIERAHSRSAEDDPDGDERLTWVDAGVETVKALVADRLASATTTPVDDVDDDVFSLVWAWYHLAPDEARAWLRQQTAEGRWSVLGVVRRLIPVGTMSGGGSTRRVLGELSLGSVDSLLGLDYVLESLADDIEGAPDIDRWALAPTPDNRSAYALAVLRRERDRRSAEPPATPDGAPAPSDDTGDDTA